MDNIIKYKDKTFIKYINHADIINRIQSIASEINDLYINEEILLIGILDGSKPTLKELMKHLKVKYTLQTIKITSYIGTQREKIVVKDKIDFSINEKMNVIIVDDIVDSGNTLAYLKKIILKKHNNIKLKAFSLLTKNKKKCDWYGFLIPNKYVIGYGLDINNLFRELNDIYVIKR